jgi:hypothetical protein
MINTYALGAAGEGFGRSDMDGKTSPLKHRVRYTAARSEQLQHPLHYPVFLYVCTYVYMYIPAYATKYVHTHVCSICSVCHVQCVPWRGQRPATWRPSGGCFQSFDTHGDWCFMTTIVQYAAARRFNLFFSLHEVSSSIGHGAPHGSTYISWTKCPSKVDFLQPSTGELCMQQGNGQCRARGALEMIDGVLNCYVAERERKRRALETYVSTRTHGSQDQKLLEIEMVSVLQCFYYVVTHRRSRSTRQKQRDNPS